jgi:hypothetical protein
MVNFVLIMYFSVLEAYQNFRLPCNPHFVVEKPPNVTALQKSLFSGSCARETVVLYCV